MGIGFDLVSCPCQQDGKPLTEQDALRRILGQAAAMQNEFTKPERVPVFAMKVGIATLRMMNCWKKKCQGPAKARDGSLLSMLSEVEVQLGTGYGGGTDC